MINGIIYLIINLHNLKNGALPYLYIGSTKRTQQFSKYYSSSETLQSDVKKLGQDSFKKIILLEREFTSIDELQTIEAEYQKEYNAISSPLFYNKSLAIGPFYDLNGSYTKDSVWITDGKTNKRVSADKVGQYPGFVRGRSNGKYMSKRIYINNGIETKAISANDRHLYKEWNDGKLKGNQAGKIWINNRVSRKLIKEEDRSSFPDWVDGWKL